ncbi:MAG TPA: MGMT family protein [Opitutus sp.]|nr:MGMT family protein [Opitutus sp.]
MQTHMPRVTFETAIGRCALSWSDIGLTGFDLPVATPRTDDETNLPDAIVALIERVQQHVNGELQDFSDVVFDFTDLPLFHAAVLRATLLVKPGETRSYGDIARLMDHPLSASRAVGAALGGNRWPLLIPCHRIVSASGKMTGFSGPGGISTKLRLLKIEGAQLFDQ